MWLLCQLDEAPEGYAVTVACRISGPFDAGVVRAALNDLVDRHAALRTRIVDQDGLPAQVVADAAEIEIALVPVEAADADRFAVVREALEQEAREPFDLADGPLVRAFALVFGPLEHVLVLTVHHIVTDRMVHGHPARRIGSRLFGARRGP